MWYLLIAEEARLARRDIRARQLYEQAVEAARDIGSLMMEGLANERFAKLWLEADNRKIAAIYLTEAINLYSRWGAAGKRDHIEGTHPWLVQEPDSSRTSRAPSRDRPDWIAAQAPARARSLASRSVIEQLLRSIVESMLDHPQRVCVLLVEKALWYVLEGRL